MKFTFDNFIIKYYLQSLALFVLNIYVLYLIKTFLILFNVDKIIFFLRQRFILYKVPLAFPKSF